MVWYRASFFYVESVVVLKAINDKDWPRTLETIKEYLASQYGGTGATLDYVVRSDIEGKPEAEDPAEGYETVDQ
jgi:hypothetical protein